MISFVETDEYIAQLVEPDTDYEYFIYYGNNRRTLVAIDKDGCKFTFCLKKRALIPLDVLNHIGVEEYNISKIEPITKTTKIIMSSVDSCFLIKFSLLEPYKNYTLFAASSFPESLLKNQAFSTETCVGAIATDNPHEYEFYCKDSNRLQGFIIGIQFILQLMEQKRDKTDMD